jgi:hypothetical protein
MPLTTDQPAGGGHGSNSAISPRDGPAPLADSVERASSALTPAPTATLAASSPLPGGSGCCGDAGLADMGTDTMTADATAIATQPHPLVGADKMVAEFESFVSNYGGYLVRLKMKCK